MRARSEAEFFIKIYRETRDCLAGSIYNSQVCAVMLHSDVWQRTASWEGRYLFLLEKLARFDVSSSLERVFTQHFFQLVVGNNWGGGSCIYKIILLPGWLVTLLLHLGDKCGKRWQKERCTRTLLFSHCSCLLFDSKQGKVQRSRYSGTTTPRSPSHQDQRCGELGVAVQYLEHYAICSSSLVHAD